MNWHIGNLTAKAVKGFGWVLAVGSLVIVTANPVMAQGKGGGGGNRGGGGGGGGVRAGGGGGGGNQGGVRVGGGGGGQARVAAPGAGAQVGGGARVGGGAQVHTPAAGGQQSLHVPGAGGQATIHTPGVNAGVNAPGANAGVHTPGGNAGASLPGVNAGIHAPGVNAPGTRAGAGPNGAQATVPHVNAATQLNGAPSIAAPNVGGAATAGVNAAGVGAGAHTALRPTFGPSGAAAGVNAGTRANAAGTNVGINAANNFRANWHNAPSARVDGVRTGLSTALKANTAALNSNTAASVGTGANVAGFRNPARANYWSNMGNGISNNFLFGNPYGPYAGGLYNGSPYFGGNFWSGRNLIGLGVASALGGGYGGYGGYGGGYGGYGNWWGYSPWLGSRPYGYWYGNPGWNSFSSYYGQPYYYDYGPSGNVVYQGGQVLVNDQPVGTAADYAQSAAELAVVTQEQIQGDHDWVPLGTFSVATSMEDKNPSRVAQLAYDNKQGLISGTIFNRQSNNLYTLQGKVDPQTQRVAFTIGNDPNAVFETGLYNLTQNATPVLLHQGPTQTQTWLFARLPEPKDEPAATTAAIPRQPADSQPSVTITEQAAAGQPAVASQPDVIPPQPPATTTQPVPAVPQE